MYYLYTSFIYNPLYNGLVILMNGARFAPWLDAGMIVILFTIVVRLILFPVSKKAARTQVLMKTVEPELAAIKEKYKDDKQAQAQHTMAFYKEKKLNPFSLMLMTFIQLPIMIALYRVFSVAGFSTIHTEILYHWVSIPPLVSTHFLGFFDITHSNIPLSLIAAVTQYFQMSISIPKVSAKKQDGKTANLVGDMMQTQMKYFLPIIVFVGSLPFASAISIYLTTSSLFMIGQELYIRRQIAKEKAI